MVTQRRELVRQLRKKGLSYGEILAQVEASKSSISKWCSDIILKPDIQRQLKTRGVRASGRGLMNQRERQVELEAINLKAKAGISSVNWSEFKLMGLMLYWAEGAKTRLVDFTNSDPKMIVVMMSWFREVLGIRDKDFKLQLHLHGGQDEKHLKNYWSNLTNIPLHQFHKSYIKRAGTGHRKKCLYYGTAKIRICNKNLLRKILGMIEGVSNQVGAVSSVGRADDSTK